MKRFFGSLIITVVLSGLSFSFCNAKKEKKNMNPGKGFAVVELFTSEGCSSCPPADEAMIKLAKEFPDHVYFLGYHVDYWDYIGWKDPFSNADYTERQQQYSDALGLSSIYTPQVIVNGQKELVGSRESQLRTIIQQALQDSTAGSVELNAKNTSAENISVSYKVSYTGPAILHIALVQLRATTNVKRGENSGHRLDHINIVREFKTIQVSKDAEATEDFKVPAGLSSKDVKLIAFIQDKKDMKISAGVEAVIQQ
jgi:hypothetical protein